MKSRFSVFLAITLFSLIGCTKEMSLENGTGKGPNATNFYATIDGVRWDADSSQAVSVDASGVSITGLSKTGAQLLLVVPVFQVGSYNISNNSDAYALYANVLEASPTFYYSNPDVAGGVINITSIDTVNHILSGNFQFSLIDPATSASKVVTAGIFENLPYTGGQVVPPPNPPGGADTLQAVINGVPFNATDIQVIPSAATGQLLIAGVAGNGTQAISLLVPANITSGTYTLDFATGTYVGFYYPTPSDILASQGPDGSLIIISNNTTAREIKGAFSFTASPVGAAGASASITNGYFSLNY